MAETQEQDFAEFETAYDKAHFTTSAPLDFTRSGIVGQDVYVSRETMLAYRGWLLGCEKAPKEDLPPAISSLLPAISEWLAGNPHEAENARAELGKAETLLRVTETLLAADNNSPNRSRFERLYRENRAFDGMANHPELFDRDDRGRYVFQRIEDHWQGYIMAYPPQEGATMTHKGLKTRITPSGDGGYRPWVLVQTEFTKEWRSAAEILKEDPRTFERAGDAEAYAEKARKAVK